jgi:hypothetical protein
VHARAVVLATGAGFRRLEVPGEERLQGRGISTCASSAQSYCDHWDAHDLGYPTLTWLLPAAFVLAGGVPAVIARRPGLAIVVGATAAIVQPALFVRSITV